MKTIRTISVKSKHFNSKQRMTVTNERSCLFWSSHVSVHEDDITATTHTRRRPRPAPSSKKHVERLAVFVGMIRVLT